MGGLSHLFQDPEVDEYGLQKPAKPFLQLGVDLVAIEPDDPWYEQIGKGLAAAPLGLGGHFLDQLPGIGGPAAGFMNEIAHSQEESQYAERRAAAAAAAERAVLGDGGTCPADPAEPTYEWMAD